MGRNAVNRKFNNNQVLEIRTKYRDGIQQKALAALFGVSQSNISSIITGSHYKDAPWPIPFVSSKDWRGLPNFPGYKFDKEGSAYSFKYNKKYGRKMKLHPDNKKGYLTVAIHDIDGKPFRRRINRIICTLFHDLPPTQKHQAMHLNGIKTDNRAINLAWGTQKENEAAKNRHGTRLIGEDVCSAKLTEVMVKQIRASKQSQRKLAIKYGVSQPTILNVIHRKRWKHVP